jgi:hypothetical protein
MTTYILETPCIARLAVVADSEIEAQLKTQLMLASFREILAKFQQKELTNADLLLRFSFSEVELIGEKKG